MMVILFQEKKNRLSQKSKKRVRHCTLDALLRQLCFIIQMVFGEGCAVLNSHLPFGVLNSNAAPQSVSFQVFRLSRRIYADNRCHRAGFYSTLINPLPRK